MGTKVIFVPAEEIAASIQEGEGQEARSKAYLLNQMTGARAVLYWEHPLDGRFHGSLEGTLLRDVGQGAWMVADKSLPALRLHFTLRQVESTHRTLDKRIVIYLKELTD